MQARLRMSDVVIDDDVNEAIRLVEKSRGKINVVNLYILIVAFYLIILIF